MCLSADATTHSQIFLFAYHLQICTSKKAKTNLRPVNCFHFGGGSGMPKTGGHAGGAPSGTSNRFPFSDMKRWGGGGGWLKSLSLTYSRAPDEKISLFCLKMIIWLCWGLSWLHLISHRADSHLLTTLDTVSDCWSCGGNESPLTWLFFFLRWLSLNSHWPLYYSHDCLTSSSLAHCLCLSLSHAYYKDFSEYFFIDWL